MMIPCAHVRRLVRAHVVDDAQDLQRDVDKDAVVRHDAQQWVVGVAAKVANEAVARQRRRGLLGARM